MKKFVLKLDLHDDKEKRKALKRVSSLGGIDSISMDMKGKMLTVIGTVDPVSVVSKLRKFWPTDIIVVGPAKEPEKKEEKKDEGKKEEPKKEEGKKEEPKKEAAKEEAKKDEPKKEEAKKEEEKKPEPMMGIVPYRPYYPPMPYRPYYPPPSTYYYVNQGAEENPNPNTCTIF